MTWQPVTTQEISNNILAQLEASFNQTIPLLPKSFIRVLARVLGAVFILLYKYGGFMFLQQFVENAVDADTVVNGQTINPLRKWGRLIGVGDPTPATQAILSIAVPVTAQGGTLPAGVSLVNADTGITYNTLDAVLLDAATVTVQAIAVADQAGNTASGTQGNMVAGQTLSFVAPLAGVEQVVTVVSQVVTGANAESTEAYRQRVLDRFQKRPQGGAYADYEGWGEEAAGVINVYPYASDFPGQVDLYVEATEASSGSPDGIPTTAQLQAVKNLVELDENGLATRRPVGALVNTFPITRTAFAVEIDGLDVSDLATTRAQIQAAVEDYFQSREPYIEGLSVPPRNDRVTTSAVAGIVQEIVSANGGVFSGLVVRFGSTLVNIYTLGAGEKAKLGSLVYT